MIISIIIQERNSFYSHLFCLRNIGLIFLVILLLPNCSSHIGKNEIIAAFKSEVCPSPLINARPFDYCISKLRLYFDELTIAEKKEVALNFLTHVQFDTSTAHQFMLLINPWHEEIVDYLTQVSDDELKDAFDLTQSDINEYRDVVDFLSKQNPEDWRR